MPRKENLASGSTMVIRKTLRSFRKGELHLSSRSERGVLPKRMKEEGELSSKARKQIYHPY